jgi:elongation factor G
MVAESDDTLMEAFFQAGELTQEQLVKGLRVSILQRKIFPVVALAATRLVGVRALLDLIVDLLPAPNARGEERGKAPGESGAAKTRPVDAAAPASVFVFKTIADPFAGRLSLFRVRSGTLKPDTTLANTRSEGTERLGSLSVMQGKHMECCAIRRTRSSIPRSSSPSPRSPSPSSPSPRVTKRRSPAPWPA